MLCILESIVRKLDPAAIIESKEFEKCKQRPNDIVELLKQYSTEAMALLLTSIERSKRYAGILSELVSDSGVVNQKLPTKYVLDAKAQNQYNEIQRLRAQIERLKACGEREALVHVE